MLPESLPPWLRPERRGLASALRALGLPRRRPTDEDRPPQSTFPLTPAAKAALRADRTKKRRP